MGRTLGMKLTLMGLAITVLIPALTTACRPRSNSSSLLADVPGATTRLTTDNIYTHSNWINGDPTYQFYIKASFLLGQTGLISSQFYQEAPIKFHADFLKTRPEFAGLDSSQIDLVALKTSGRKVFLAVLLVKPFTDDTIAADLQILSHDPLPANEVKKVLDAARANHPGYLTELGYSPVAEQKGYVVQHRGEFDALGIKIAETADSRDLVCYARGWTVGRVRILKAADLPTKMAAGEINPDDILVMDETPREIPIVAGVIVGSTSSPSSHVALLSQMAGNPFFYEKGAFTSPRWAKYAQDGRPIFLTNQSYGCGVEVQDAADLLPAEVAKLTSFKKPAPVVITAYDQSPTALLPLSSLGRADKGRVGAKAANVAELAKVIPDHTVVGGFGIPITFFGKYMSAGQAPGGGNLGDFVKQQLQAMSSPQARLGDIMTGLEKIREAIEKGTTPPGLAEAITSPISGLWPNGSRVKLRSSSNVEDNKDFNGAGLYESKGACVGDDSRTEGSFCQGEDKPKGIVKNAKKVWASLYTLKGYLARRYYSVDEVKAGMGILVQASYKGELANGVLISWYNRPSWEGDTAKFQVNLTGFPGEDLEVTNPPAGKVPETTIIDEERSDIQVRSTELPVGRALLTEPQYKEVWAQARKAHDHFVAEVPAGEKENTRYDMEWKLISDSGQDKVIIKQIRPVSPEGRTGGLRGRGTNYVGVRSEGLFCPSPSEDDDGLKKLLTSYPIRARVALHELVAGTPTQMPSPFEKLEIDLGAGFVPATTATTVKVTAEPWKLNWEKNEERSIRSCLPLAKPTVPKLELCWAEQQVRRVEARDYLLAPVQPYYWSTISVGGKSVPTTKGPPSEAMTFYSFVAGATKCEMDAYQGSQPGVKRPGFERSMTTEPQTTAFPRGQGGTVSIRMKTREGRNLPGGPQFIDKTAFAAVDELCVTGLTQRELCVKKPLRSVYAPAHHAFSFQYASDLYQAEGLTTAEKNSLIQKRVQYVVFPSLSGSTQIAVGVSESFRKKSLGAIVWPGGIAPLAAAVNAGTDQPAAE